MDVYDVYFATIKRSILVTFKQRNVWDIGANAPGHWLGVALPASPGWAPSESPWAGGPGRPVLSL